MKTMGIPDYPIEEVKTLFPIVNDDETFTAFIEYAVKHKHMPQIHKYLKQRGFIESGPGCYPFVAEDILTTGKEPFNVFAHAVINDKSDQWLIREYADNWKLCHNKPENDLNWNNPDNKFASMCGPDEEGPGHVFITTCKLDWRYFNILTIVLMGEVNFLLDLKEVATKYAMRRGWEKAGFYFHCFPHNSVNSLHLHVCNEGEQYIGHTHEEGRYKNIPIDVAIAVARKRQI